MKAITVREPWAWLLSEGFKDQENRVSFTKFQGRIFIHSSTAFVKDFDKVEHFVGVHFGIIIPSREALRLNQGRIIGVADFGPMTGFNTKARWGMNNHFAWPVRWAHPIKPSEIIRGQLGVWGIKDAAERPWRI